MTLADTRFESRRRALASTLAAQRIDAILVTNLLHVRYLSGFSGSNGALLLRKDLSAKIATDGRYTTQIAEQVPDVEAVITRNVATDLLSSLQGPTRVAFEADYVTVATFERLQKALADDIELVPVRGVIEKQRQLKDDFELQRLQEVAELANVAFNNLIAEGDLAVGMTEIQVAAQLEYRMRTLGAERVSFDTIVASGPNSAKPHHGASDRVIDRGDLVTIDFGAHLRGYNSDMTRTLVMGEPTDFAREIYEVVLKAQLSGIEAAVPGTSLADVDRACRDVIAQAGFGEYFVHSTGHGIGIEVHERPFAATTGEGELQEGMTLTIEPGVYIPGKGGVRIEDTLLITHGAPKIITRFPKELTVIGS
ncbi:MAG: aminopeptidase P family protein [Corynebacterium sp.]|nr:aminopeptidase P family protein [Corynebacterium sp.]